MSQIKALKALSMDFVDRSGVLGLVLGALGGHHSTHTGGNEGALSTFTFGEDKVLFFALSEWHPINAHSEFLSDIKTEVVNLGSFTPVVHSLEDALENVSNICEQYGLSADIAWYDTVVTLVIPQLFEGRLDLKRS